MTSTLEDMERDMAKFMRDTLYADHPGEARPFVAGIFGLDTMDARRGPDGVWAVAPEIDDE